MAITLGKDCYIRMDGGTITSARNVQLTETARTIEIGQYGSREAAVYSTGYECAVSVELNDVSEIMGGFQRIHSGTSFTVSGGAGGFSFEAIVMSISESDPIDGVVSCTIEGKMTKQGLRTG